MTLYDGLQVVLHVHHARQPARVDQLVSLLDPKKGTVLRQRPRHLTANQSAIVEVWHLFLQYASLF
jgi:elongation factor 1 alpha-like protein